MTSYTRLLKEKLELIYEEDEPKVRIPIEKGELGLSLDAPLDKYKKQVTSGEKDWETLSKQINTLAVFNKNKNPDISKKARDKRDALASWVEKKRESDPEFGK